MTFGNLVGVSIEPVGSNPKTMRLTVTYEHAVLVQIVEQAVFNAVSNGIPATRMDRRVSARGGSFNINLSGLWAICSWCPSNTRPNASLRRLRWQEWGGPKRGKFATMAWSNLGVDFNWQSYIVLNSSLDAKAHLPHPFQNDYTLCGQLIGIITRTRMGERVCRKCEGRLNDSIAKLRRDDFR